MDTKHTVLLVGSHAILMEAISARLERETSFSEVCMPPSHAEAVAAVQHKPCDLVLMDIDRGQPLYFQLAQRLLKAASEIHMIFVSATIEDDTFEKALQLGVRGVIFKDDLHTELMPALREILDGGTWFPLEIRNRITIDSHGAKLGS